VAWQADIARFKQVLAKRAEEAGEKEKALAKSKQELDALNETLRQVETYNEEMKNEISITRRATYKVEEALVDLGASSHTATHPPTRSPPC
jgi:septal ring factor EnvC (AmiA/AmiB activator)